MRPKGRKNCEVKSKSVLGLLSPKRSSFPPSNTSTSPDLVVLTYQISQIKDKMWQRGAGCPKWKKKKREDISLTQIGNLIRNVSILKFFKCTTVNSQCK